jgi:hypothetical protein
VKNINQIARQMTVVMEHARLQGPSSALDQRVMATSDSAPSTVVKSPFRPVDDHCVYAADFIPVDSQSHLIHLEQMDGHWFTRKHLAVILRTNWIELTLFIL